VNTRSLFALPLVLFAACSSKSETTTPPAETGPRLPVWLSDAKILVSGHDVANEDCRTAICRHNENTDLVRFKGAIYLVHRTAISQILGPNSALHVYRSTDSGKTFKETALIAAPKEKLSAEDTATEGRDLRDPHFYVVGDKLMIKALTRLPVISARDSNVDTIAVVSTSIDGDNWTKLEAVGPKTWSFWRIKQNAGVYYNVAYEDGDKSVALFSSTDGVTWKKGVTVYSVAEDTPLETEIELMPSGRMLALVRMDGKEEELLGIKGRLRTKVCWSMPPYSSFDCSQEIDSQRLDGPVSFQWKGRLFVVARKHHLGPNGAKKRTSLFELTGNLEGGPLSIKDHGDFPSAGDTAYAGAVSIDDTRMLVTWYSGDLVDDDDWFRGMLLLTDIWQGTIDLSKLP